ncbi:protein of unknown function [Streptomyces murinus]
MARGGSAMGASAGQPSRVTKVHASAVAWGQLEGELGVVLPGDYKHCRRLWAGAAQRASLSVSSGYAIVEPRRVDEEHGRRLLRERSLRRAVS